eukprot:1485003-Prymnesium_polylepis.1
MRACATDDRCAAPRRAGTLAICDSARLLKVPAQLLPLQHLACSRSLCTAYRILEDYGNVKPGDTVLQNCADMPTGQAVIQLCKMLKIRTINLVPDDAGFDRTKEVRGAALERTRALCGRVMLAAAARRRASRRTRGS